LALAALIAKPAAATVTRWTATELAASLADSMSRCEASTFPTTLASPACKKRTVMIVQRSCNELS